MLGMEGNGGAGRGAANLTRCLTCIRSYNSGKTAHKGLSSSKATCVRSYNSGKTAHKGLSISKAPLSYPVITFPPFERKEGKTNIVLHI